MSTVIDKWLLYFKIYVLFCFFIEREYFAEDELKLTICAACFHHLLQGLKCRVCSRLKKNSDKVNQKLIFFYRAANMADNCDITHTIKLIDLFYVRNTCSIKTKLNSAASITFF